MICKTYVCSSIVGYDGYFKFVEPHSNRPPPAPSSILSPVLSRRVHTGVASCNLTGFSRHRPNAEHQDLTFWLLTISRIVLPVSIPLVLTLETFWRPDLREKALHGIFCLYTRFLRSKVSLTSKCKHQSVIQVYNCTKDFANQHELRPWQFQLQYALQKRQTPNRIPHSALLWCSYMHTTWIRWCTFDAATHPSWRCPGNLQFYGSPSELPTQTNLVITHFDRIRKLHDKNLLKIALFWYQELYTLNIMLPGLFTPKEWITVMLGGEMKFPYRTGTFSLCTRR